MRVNVADEPANGTIPADAGPPGPGTETRTYTPRAGFIGTDTFTYNAPSTSSGSRHGSPWR